MIDNEIVHVAAGMWVKADGYVYFLHNCTAVELTPYKDIPVFKPGETEVIQ